MYRKISDVIKCEPSQDYINSQWTGQKVAPRPVRPVAPRPATFGKRTS